MAGEGRAYVEEEADRSSRWSGTGRSFERCSPRDRAHAFWGVSRGLGVDARGYPLAMGVPRADAPAARAQGRADPVRRARRARRTTRSRSFAGASRTRSRSTTRSRACRSWSRRTGSTGPHGRDSSGRSAAQNPRVPAPAVSARGQGRSASTAACARRPSDGPRVHGREQRVDPMRCAPSSRTSPTTRWAMSADSFGSRRPTARTWRAPTGATRCGCASRSRQRARSPRATVRSTR
jgi:hypothetical protein